MCNTLIEWSCLVFSALRIYALMSHNVWTFTLVFLLNLAPFVATAVSSFIARILTCGTHLVCTVFLFLGSPRLARQSVVMWLEYHTYQHTVSKLELQIVPLFIICVGVCTVPRATLEVTHLEVLG